MSANEWQQYQIQLGNTTLQQAAQYSTMYSVYAQGLGIRKVCPTTGLELPERAQPKNFWNIVTGMPASTGNSITFYHYPLSTTTTQSGIVFPLTTTVTTAK